jgi:hypothetical protein
MFEAYREMGTALHTLEDFLAHCKSITCYSYLQNVQEQRVDQFIVSLQPTTSNSLLTSLVIEMFSVTWATTFACELQTGKTSLPCEDGFLLLSSR